jgi:glycosyltransferase involved in cell wall biosynthesis
MRLLQILRSLDPVGGGPMEGVMQSALACIKMGHSVEIATLDDPGAAFLRDTRVPIHALGPSLGGYGYARRYVPWLRKNAHDYDAVVVNALWQYHSLGAWRALHGSAVPYYVFPHGMLDPWFKHAYPLKHVKKWLYWPWADYRLLRDAKSVLFTCEEERRLARGSFSRYRANEVVAAFGTAAPPADADRLREEFLAAHPRLRGYRLLLFLSRIHEKKGCDLLIDAYARLAADRPDIRLVIAGPDQTGLKQRLEAQAERLQIADRIEWPGMLRGDMKWGAFYAADAFVLPSHQENFGIAVAEALGCGLPVLISDKVNIWREIAQARAGFVATDSVDGCEATLRQWLMSSASDRQDMQARAAGLFRQRFTVEAMARSLIEIVGGVENTAALAR